MCIRDSVRTARAALANTAQSQLSPSPLATPRINMTGAALAPPFRGGSLPRKRRESDWPGAADEEPAGQKEVPIAPAAGVPS
eukprot:13970265-Alexandrium_andersonii.AAC.1